MPRPKRRGVKPGVHQKEVARLRAEVPLKLWTFKDIAWAFDVATQTARKWADRYDDFPEPVSVVNGYMKIFDTAEVERWYALKLVTHRKSFGRATSKPQQKPPATSQGAL